MSTTPLPPHHDEQLKELPIIVDLGKKPPNLKYLAVVFFIQGIALLLAFNAMINSVVFFNKRANPVHNGHYIMDYYLIAFAVVRFLSMIFVPIYMRGGSPYRQIWMSQLGNVAVFAIFALFLLWETMNPIAFVVLTIIVVILLSTFSVIAFFGIFTIIAHIPDYSEQLGTVISYGQGAAGTTVCLLKLVSLTPFGDTFSHDYDSLFFFVLAALFITFSLLVFIPVRNIRRSDSMLTLVPEDKLGTRSVSPFYQPPKATGPLREWLSYYFHIYRQIPVYFWTIFILFFQTMTLIPTFIFMNPSTRLSKMHSRFFEEDMFNIVNLLLYNLGDWLGRFVIGIERLNIKNRWILFGLSILRFGLMPFYIWGNLTLSHTASPVGHPLANDLGFAIVNFAYGLTAGYLATLVMEHAPETVDDKKDRRYALFILMHCMTFALLIGSIFSFVLEVILYAYGHPHHPPTSSLNTGH